MDGTDRAPRYGTRERQLHQIAQLGRLLLASVDEEEVLRGVARGMCEFGGMVRCLIVSYTTETGELVGRAGHGLDHDQVLQVREHVDAAPPIVEAIEQQRVVLVPDPHVGPAVPVRYLEWFEVTGALAFVPLHSVELGVLGVAVLDRGGGPFELSDDQRQAMAVFGDLAAMAMRHARFVERSARLAAVVERNRVAAELHDSISQTLHAARLKLSELLEAGGLPADVRRLAEDANELATESANRLHQALYALAEGEADEREPSEVLAAIREALTEFGEQSGLSVDLFVRGEGPEPSPRVARLLLRTTREGLTNVYKYASATEVAVSVRRGRGWWSLDVSDDGDGDPRVVRRHLSMSPTSFGLASLSNDAQGLGGRLYVGGAARLGGISLSVSVPVDADQVTAG